jgi:hypothetical protein
MNYLWWPVLTVAFYSFHAYLSFQNKGATDVKSFMIVWVVGACFPLWAIISRYSKNLMFDAMVFDLLLMLSYAITFAILEQRTLSGVNIAGVGVAVVGLIMVKI